MAHTPVHPAPSKILTPPLLTSSRSLSWFPSCLTCLPWKTFLNKTLAVLCLLGLRSQSTTHWQLPQQKCKSSVEAGSVRSRCRGRGGRGSFCSRCPLPGSTCGLSSAGLCAQMSPFWKDTSPRGREPTVMPASQSSAKTPFPNSQGLGVRTSTSFGDTIRPPTLAYDPDLDQRIADC